MLSPEHLRVLVRRHLNEAKRESTSLLRRRLASHALALAQLAETIERRTRQSSPARADLAAAAKRISPVLLLTALPDLLDAVTALPQL